MGNCGEALRRVLHWSEQHRLRNLQASWDLLSTAVANPESIIKWAGPPALLSLLRRLESLSQEMGKWLKGGLGTLEKFRHHRQEEHSHHQNEPWLRKVLGDRLLLTFNLSPLNSRDEALDDAFFDTLSFGMSEEDERKSIVLINIINGLKEEFVSARYLYYHSRDEPRRLARWNYVTHYGDPEGAAEFGLVSGLLKASFRLSIDLLDKIAAFLVLYFELGDPTQSYNFNNFWYTKRDAKRAILHPSIAAKLQYNDPLRGLYDLKRDFQRQEFPGPVKEARNAAVHRWLTLYWLPIENGGNSSSTWSLDDFFHLTAFMLRQSKASILLLMAVVNIEERRNKSVEGGGKAVRLPKDLTVRPPVSARAAEDVDKEIGVRPKDSGGLVKPRSRKTGKRRAKSPRSKSGSDREGGP